MEAWREELYSNELYHHGVAGQKWGVRLGPPYPLDMSRKEYKKQMKTVKNKLKDEKKFVCQD